MEVTMRCPSLHAPPSFLSSSARHLLSLPSSSSSRTPISTSSSLSCSLMATQDEGRRKFLDFPFVSTPHKNLMLDLVSAVENRFNLQLLPCTLPPDVQYYQSQSGTAQASLQIRSGQSDSPVISLSNLCYQIYIYKSNFVDIYSFLLKIIRISRSWSHK